MEHLANFIKSRFGKFLLKVIVFGLIFLFDYLFLKNDAKLFLMVLSAEVIILFLLASCWRIYVSYRFQPFEE